MPFNAYILIAALAALSTGPVLAAMIAYVIRSRQTSEWTPAHMAYVLMREVMKAEDRIMPSDKKGDGHKADRKWLLDTYAECMLAIESPGTRHPGSSQQIGPR